MSEVHVKEELDHAVELKLQSTSENNKTRDEQEDSKKLGFEYWYNVEIIIIRLSWELLWIMQFIIQQETTVPQTYEKKAQYNTSKTAYRS